MHFPINIPNYNFSLNRMVMQIAVFKGHFLAQIAYKHIIKLACSFRMTHRGKMREKTTEDQQVDRTHCRQTGRKCVFILHQPDILRVFSEK